MAKERLKPHELEYIKQNCLTLTDESMAQHLNRDVRTISYARKKLGIIKRAGGKLEGIGINSKASEPNQLNLVSSQRLTEDQRKEYYRTQFANSLYYDNLKQQFTPDELDFYLEEWGTLCLQ